MKTFSIKKAVNFGWRTTLKNKRFLIGLTLLTFIIESIFNYGDRIIFVSQSTSSSYSALGFDLVGWVVNAVFTLGLIKIALGFVDHGSPKFEDLWWVFRKPGKLISYIGALLVYGILVGVWVFIVVGASLFWTVGSYVSGPSYWLILVIPAAVLMIYFGIKYSLFAYPIVDHQASALKSLGRSSDLTRGIKLRLILFGMVLAGINLLGVLALVVGLLISIPTTMLATAHVYRELSPKN